MCGNPDDQETSNVSIRLVTPEMVTKGDDSIQEIPTDVEKLSVWITVYDPGTEETLKAIQEDVTITPEMRSEGFILLRYEVPNGSCSINVEAYDSGEQPLYYGHTHVDLTGGYYEVRIPMGQM